MFEQAYRYRFGNDADLAEAEETLLLAILAAEGLYGRARVHVDAAYAVDRSIRALIVDAAGDVGEDINAVFTAFLLREFGGEGFAVRRVGRQRCRGEREDRP